MKIFLLCIALTFAAAICLQAETRHEAESLSVVKKTSGDTSAQNLAEMNLSKPGEFGQDTILWWTSTKPGAVLELKVPVSKDGRYDISVHIARSWDYGIHQFLVNGVKSGPAVDFGSHAEPERTIPGDITLRGHLLKKGGMRLGLQVIGPSEGSDSESLGAGLDWVELTQAGETGGTEVTVIGKPALLQAESLKILGKTSGETSVQNLVEAGLAEPGQFGRNRILFWEGASKGSELTLSVPCSKEGRYVVELGLAKSWDYGLFQFYVDGAPAGEPLDMNSHDDPTKTVPFRYKLGTFNIKPGAFKLGMKAVGYATGYESAMGGIDYVSLTPAKGD